MGYCFVRIDKIKTAADFIRKYEHNYRTEYVPNAIPELKSENEELIKLMDKEGNPCNYLDAYHEKIDSLDYYKSHKIRKTNILGLEVFTTFSRESKEQIDIEQWKSDNVQWIREYFNASPEKYGDNVISVMYHGDENGNVHCHAIVIPIGENGTLNANSFIGGRAKLRNLQDSYAKVMEKHGLQRGLKGSSARHEDISKFYAKLNSRMEVPFPEKNETAEEYRERIMIFVQTERADSLRKVMEMDRQLRRERDSIRQRDILAAKGTVQAEKASLEADLSDIRKNIVDGKNELLDIQKQIFEQDQKLSHKLKKYDTELKEKSSEIADMNARAREIHKKIGDLEKARKDLDAYRTQQAILEYGKKELPLLAENALRSLDALADAYENREITK